jgi:hypothetical protein
MIAFVMIVGAIVSGAIAASRNRNVIGWGIAGACLPLISALILIASPALPSQHQLHD